MGPAFRRVRCAKHQAATLLYAWADATLFATTKVYSNTVAKTGEKKIVHATGTNERVVYTEKRPGHPGGTGE